MIRSTSTYSRARAFTLIEVMIAVLILALALLGLGAVFPVAVRAQRISSEDTLGTAAVNSARAVLRGYDFHSAMMPWISNTTRDTRDFWRDWRDDPQNGLNHPSPIGGPPSADDQGYWVVPVVSDVSNDALLGVPANAALGRPISSQVLLPIHERLAPLGAAGDPPPQFVWDIAVHRAPDFNYRTDSTHDDLEIAVFVRRIDPRIKPPANFTLYQVLTGERAGGVGDANRRRPVAVFPSGPQMGLPTGDGDGLYAVPVTADVEFRFNPPAQPARDRLYVLGSVDQAHWQMIRQPGQKLVDNLGQIHTVRSFVEDGSDRYVILEAPVRTPVSSAGLIEQVVFTPQVPASVFIERVKP